MNTKFDAIIIGAGPAGLATAVTLGKGGMSALIIEREAKAGGILKQCVHDGFGVIRFGEKLSGPEYALRYLDMVQKYPSIHIKLLTFVTAIKSRGGHHVVTVTSRDGIEEFEADNLVFACGCRERTARQIFLQGTRPAGVMTAGVAQNFVNLQGYMPTKKCVILGSGDIGLIMARRLTLEGAEVVGVYEAKSTPGGLSRNIAQCLNDFDIPLHLSHTVTRVMGEERVEAVEVAKVDENLQPIKGTEEIIRCDALILSVGLIPENELAKSLSVSIDKSTKGPTVDQNMMTMKEHIYCVGNALHVHDLVDYVSESAEIAGEHMVRAGKKARNLVGVEAQGLGYIVPGCIDINDLKEETVMFFRSAKVMNKARLKILVNGEEIFAKEYPLGVRPPEMERITPRFTAKEGMKITAILEEVL